MSSRTKTIHALAVKKSSSLKLHITDDRRVIICVKISDLY